MFQTGSRAGMIVWAENGRWTRHGRLRSGDSGRPRVAPCRQRQRVPFGLMGTADTTSGNPAASSGSRFVRADLHVHTHSDGDLDPHPDLAGYVAAALAAGLEVLAITDHNHVRFVRAAVAAATGTGLTILPGIEITTHDGHLLALFAPDSIEDLEALAHRDNLCLKNISQNDVRSSRSMLHLVDEIHARGGLAIPAHIDAANGAAERLAPTELSELLSSPGLAGIEFARTDSLRTWFTDDDQDEHRRAAWRARQSIDELRERGLGRLMSSDAHAPDKVGLDRRSRTMTRLRLDAITFDAIRNAIVFNPKARCKAEAVLPATYPAVVSARFDGGFLDGVEMRFSQNLNCLIGGRGSGKSTALLAIRAALGASIQGEDPDAEGRMPDKTTVDFVDNAGSVRTATRVRGGDPTDPTGAPVRLRLADLGQDESGRLAMGYASDPQPLLDFLDGFVVRHRFDELESDLIAKLEDNGAEVKLTAVRRKQVDDLNIERQRLEASLKAAQESRVEEIARWAVLLASQGPLLEALHSRIQQAVEQQSAPEPIDLDALAAAYGVDLDAAPASRFVSGEHGLRRRLETFQREATHIASRTRSSLADAAGNLRASLDAWRAEHNDLQGRLATRRSELEDQGLKVQADAVSEYATRLEAVKSQLTRLEEQRARHREALRERQDLLDDLHANRDNLYQARAATLTRIAAQANSYSDDLTIRVFYQHAHMNEEWVAWLTKLGFNRPRVNRLAAQIGPRAFAEHWFSSPDSLMAIMDPANSQPFFTEVPAIGRSWDELFYLQTLRCDDRPRIEVQRRGEPERQPFDRLSAGQQRSVLLSLLLCAERSEPLILDQPEDHLDGQYIASAVVRHLEAAKERRQILIATHSANLVVLGDAELVIPMTAIAGRGIPVEVGAVDRPHTRDQVVALLEGGIAAFRKRGERYGLRFER